MGNNMKTHQISFNEHRKMRDEIKELLKENERLKQSLRNVHTFDYQKAFDTYYPVIEECRKLLDFYCGETKHVCPDNIGPLLTALINAQQTMNVVKDVPRGTEEE